jgi:hypothetical protein
LCRNLHCATAQCAVTRSTCLGRLRAVPPAQMPARAVPARCRDEKHLSRPAKSCATCTVLDSELPPSAPMPARAVPARCHDEEHLSRPARSCATGTVWEMPPIVLAVPASCRDEEQLSGPAQRPAPMPARAVPAQCGQDPSLQAMFDQKNLTCRISVSMDRFVDAGFLVYATCDLVVQLSCVTSSTAIMMASRKAGDVGS